MIRRRKLKLSKYPRNFRVVSGDICVMLVKNDQQEKPNDVERQKKFTFPCFKWKI